MDAYVTVHICQSIHNFHISLCVCQVYAHGAVPGCACLTPLRSPPEG